MAGRVLSDASPLIGLARVDGLPWLRALFGEVWVPQEVRSEVISGRDLPDEQALRAAFDSGNLQICGPTPTLPALPDLDEGEAAKAVFARLHASDFRISAEVIAEILRRVGER